MKTLFTSLLMSLLVVLAVTPAVLAVNVGTGLSPIIETEDFEPLVWMCDSRVVYDDATEPGRISQDGTFLTERINNYAFEGEQISWNVLVMDKNKADQGLDVTVTVGDVQGIGNPVEVNCLRVAGEQSNFESCNARILEEQVQWDPDLMAFFECTFTVETPESMYGEYWITVEATDLDGLSGTMDENEYWFLNPVVALSIDGDLVFEDVRPGTHSYSSTLLVGNDADTGSGVLMDMFISGTDFYDSASSAARCPTSNQLVLNSGGPGGAGDFTGFRYFATSGSYSTLTDAGDGRAGGVGGASDRDIDAEGYVDIGYGIGFNDPHPFYRGYEIIQTGPTFIAGPYYGANVLAPGAEMAVTFKLVLPEPCNGDFDTGSIFFWGEAI